MCVQKIVLCPFQCNPRPSGVSLESPGLEHIPQVSENREEVDQNHDARNAVPATVSVLKCSCISAHKLESERSKVLLCPFHCKPRPSGVSLEYAEVENIPPVPGNRAQVAQNHDARKAVSATLSVLK